MNEQERYAFWLTRLLIYPRGTPQHRLALKTLNLMEFGNPHTFERVIDLAKKINKMRDVNNQTADVPEQRHTCSKNCGHIQEVKRGDIRDFFAKISNMITP